MLHILLAADPSAPPDLSPLAQIGIGALILLPISSGFWAFFRYVFKPMRQELQETRSSLSEAFANQLARERELSDRLGPLLASTVDVLAKTPESIDRALREAKMATPRSEVDDRINRLERLVERAVEERRGG